MGTHWDVLVDLWTVEAGESNLVLCVRVFESEDGGCLTEVDSVRVPQSTIRRCSRSCEFANDNINPNGELAFFAPPLGDVMGVLIRATHTQRLRTQKPQSDRQRGWIPAYED